MLGSSEQMHGDEPVAVREFGPMKKGSATERETMMAVFALELVMGSTPVVFCTPANRADNTLFQPLRRGRRQSGMQYIRHPLREAHDGLHGRDGSCG